MGNRIRIINEYSYIMKKIYLLALLLIGACCNGSICAQTSIPDTLLFVFKLHGQTRKYEMSFREQDDTLRLDWRILRNLHWQKGSYLMAPASQETGNTLCFLQPVDKENRLLDKHETAYVLSHQAYKELKANGAFRYNQTVYKKGDKKGEALGCPLIHCIDQTEGAEMWILDNESLPLVWKMQNNPLNVNWQVDHPSALYKDPIEVVVHRGANHLAPENTVASAYAALRHGATWIELDVRKSKDGVLYNLHDETLDRTTNGKGALADMNSEEVDKLDAGSWFGKEYAGTHVPRIAEMLDSLYGKAKVFFDVKRGTPVSDLVRVVRLKGFATNSFFWFADEGMLKEFIRLAPEMKIKVNASDIARLQYWMTICRPSVVEIDPKQITPEFKAFCKANGIHIMAAIQNGTEEAYRTAIEKEPDLVNLDQPELFEKVLAE